MAAVSRFFAFIKVLLKKVKRFLVRLPLGGEKHGVLSAVFGFPLEGKLSRSD